MVGYISYSRDPVCRLGDQVWFMDRVRRRKEGPYIVSWIFEDRQYVRLCENDWITPVRDDGPISVQYLRRGDGSALRFAARQGPRENDPDASSSNYTSQSERADSMSTIATSARVLLADEYIFSMTDELAQSLLQVNLNSKGLNDLFGTLPDLLEIFALRLGYGSPSVLELNIMGFIHSHRHKIAHRLRDNSPQPTEPQDETDELKRELGRETSTGVKLRRFTSALDTTEDDADFENEGGKDISEDFDSDDESNDLPTDMTLFRDCVIKSQAYRWLVETMLCEATQTLVSLDIRSAIWEKVFRSIHPREGRKALKSQQPTRAYQVTFVVDWDSQAFTSQTGLRGRDESDSGVIELGKMLTLTGVVEDCQALTVSQYLSQTWPTTGQHVLDLIQAVIEARPGDHRSATLIDRTELDIESKDSKLFVNAIGPVVSVAEIAEQFGWLVAALVPFEHQGDDTVHYSVPQITDLEEIRTDLRSTSTTKFHGQYICHVRTDLHQVPTGAANGECWLSMFRSPVIVRGYPVLRRTALNAGLEMPLNIMGSMVRTNYITPFDSTWCLKGFSSMLTLSEQRGDLFLWHHDWHQDGRRISYFDRQKVTLAETTLSLSDIQSGRHIVGWCSDVKLYTGALDNVNYDISASNLPRPHSSCVLETASISSGWFLSGGATVRLGARETPLHLTQDTYREKMRWVSEQRVILWDNKDNRGWLVDGANALLHLVRSSIEDQVQWMNKYAPAEVLYNKGNMVEPTALHTVDAALMTLMSSKNREMKLFVDDAGDQDGEVNVDVRRDDTGAKYTRFKDVVEKQHNLLEQIMDHQFHAENRPGLEVKLRIRKHVEGWDFRDLVVPSKAQRIYPRVMALPTLTRGWVDFARQIGAITLFGQNFGDLMIPDSKESICDHWARVPSGRFYLAVPVSILRHVMGLNDEQTHVDSPIKMTHDLEWHATSQLFTQRCDSVDVSSCGHQPVQVLAPPKEMLWKASRRSETVELKPEAAVIFGYTANLKLPWSDQSSLREDTVSESSPSLQSGTGTSLATTATTIGGESVFQAYGSLLSTGSGVSEDQAVHSKSEESEDKARSFHKDPADQSSATSGNAQPLLLHPDAISYREGDIVVQPIDALHEGSGDPEILGQNTDTRHGLAYRQTIPERLKTRYRMIMRR